MRLEPHRLVFLDETGTTTKMTRLRGRCLKGKRLRSKAPFGHWKTQTFVAGLRCGALTAPFVIDAPMDRRIFETYVETELVPTLEKGDIVIMDNLPAHKSPIAKKAILDRGARQFCSCRLQPRSQPDRDGLLKTQGLPARQSCPNNRRALESHRANLRPVPTRRVQKLLQRRRIRIQLNVRSSNRLLRAIQKQNRGGPGTGRRPPVLS
jgi:DDE superfamily endonuclease